ncbi:tetratricopeptide repeat protein [Hydrocarboniphaga sp.]|uniref:tetratricopeptide repeat protein n=1 Tax=Hydrocarboniphaga sp. TaxID=2033016 RepID=UPI003D0EA418
MFNNPISKSLVLLALGLVLAMALPAHADTLGDRIAELQHGWAQAYYQVPEAEKESRFDALITRSESVVAEFPARAEPMIWEAIVLSSAAKFQGGLGALDKIKRARDLLLAAEKIDPKALDGSVYTSLGSLYAKAPGWPLAFGDKKQAAAYLQKALAINPDGIDPNYFYGDLLLEQKQNAEAQIYLTKALAAAPRPGREDADAGRRAEVQQALARLSKR